MFPQYHNFSAELLWYIQAKIWLSTLLKDQHWRIKTFPRKKRCKGFEKVRHFLRGKKKSFTLQCIFHCPEITLILHETNRKNKIYLSKNVSLKFLCFRFVLKQFLVYSLSTLKMTLHLFDKLQAFKSHLEFTVIRHRIASADKHVNIRPHF